MHAIHPQTFCLLVLVASFFSQAASFDSRFSFVCACTENRFQNLLDRSSPLSRPRIRTRSSMRDFSASPWRDLSSGAQARAGEGGAAENGLPTSWPWNGEAMDDGAYDRLRVSR